MTLYDCGLDERVLLLGEGNFSFSLALVNYLKVNNPSVQQFCNLFASCLETEPISHQAEQNIEALKRSGVNITFGVDATNISRSFDGVKFERVIFNFPHVGKKMKIHLNRSLLRDFFSNVDQVLLEDGDVLVALCAGQSGVPVDPVQRRPADTWQIVEMAAHGDFALVEYEHFPHDLFPSYVSVGYRGRDQSFRNEKGLVYLFRKLCPPVFQPLLNPESIGNETYEGVDYPSFYCDIIRENPFSRVESPQSILLGVIKRLLLIPEVTLPLFVSKFTGRTPVCSVDNELRSLRSTLSEVAPTFDRENIMAFGIVFCDLTGDFTSPPGKCHVLVLGPDSVSHCVSALKGLFTVFNLTYLLKWVENKAFIEDEGSDPIIVNFKAGQHCELDLDYLCLYLFKLNSRKDLWSRNLEVTGITSASMPILYSSQFIFDISFVESPCFTPELLYAVLWKVASSVIDSVRFLNDYCPEGQQRSLCYRIVYKSFDTLLFRKRTVDIHNLIIAKSLENCLNVKVI